MYRACRHIKVNGLRCDSPALKESLFCYFHSKVHSIGAEPYSKFGPMRLPSPEDPSAIQLSIAQISDALIKGSLDPRRAGQLLFAIQIASQNLKMRNLILPSKLVHSFTTSVTGDELAPEKFVCKLKDDCNDCPFSDQCPRCIHPDDEAEDDAQVEATPAWCLVPGAYCLVPGAWFLPSRSAASSFRFRSTPQR